MKKIKFKLWDEGNKTMFGPFTLAELMKIAYPIDYDSGEVVLLISTGGLDSNGAEMFSGDIVRIITYEEDKKVKAIRYIYIKYNKCKFNIPPLDKLGADSHVEIVGNIYENSLQSLLNGAKL